MYMYIRVKVNKHDREPMRLLNVIQCTIQCTWASDWLDEIEDHSHCCNAEEVTPFV